MNTSRQRVSRRHAWIVLAMALLLGVAGLLGLSRVEAVSLLPDSVADRFSDQNGPQPFQADDQPSLTRSDFFLPGVAGENSGKRQNDVRAAGFNTLLRPSGPGHITRGGFMLFGNIRSPYGAVRPHLVFCCLRN